MRETAIVSHSACALHDTGWHHPEHQGRLPAIVKAIYRETPALLDRMLQEEAPAASRDDLLRVHSPAHLAAVQRGVERARAAGRPVDLTQDTIVSGASWEAGLGAAGAALHAARLVLEGKAGTAFALTRPPGHHATTERPMGFCLFNNAAVAARWARDVAGAERVLIVDWDVHHGNGTQDIFYGDPSVYYLSLHMTGHYPGTGHTHQTGLAEGEGTTRNVPFPPGVEREYYLRVYDEVISMVFDEFTPDLVLVSAGYDCLAGDPLGGLLLEPPDLHAMTRRLIECAGGRVVALLEGGYVPHRTAAGVVQTIRAMAGLPAAAADD